MGDTHRAIIEAPMTVTPAATVEHKEAEGPGNHHIMHDIKEFLEKHQWHAEDYAMRGTSLCRLN